MPWNLAIHHIGVGQGDATLIVATETSPQGTLQRVRSALIDGGNRGLGALLYAYLTRHIPEVTPGSRRLDVLVVTHYDADHYCGIIELLRTPNTHLFDSTQVFDQGHPPYDRYHFRKTLNHRAKKAADFERFRGALDYVRQQGGTIRRITRNVNSFYLTHLTAKGRDYVRPTTAHFTAPPLLTGSTVLDPDWLVRKEILWGNGVLAPHYTSAPPTGAPTITCVAANKYVAAGLPTDTTTRFCSRVGRFFLADDGMSDRPSRKLESVEEYNRREGYDSNGKSLAFEVRFGRFRYYLGGDLEQTQEDPLAAYLNPTNDDAGRVHAIKTSHHGAAEASSDAFVARLRPLTAIISCGRDNTFGHPSERLIKTLEGRGNGYYVTELPYRSVDENRRTADEGTATGYASASALAHARALPQSCDDRGHACAQVRVRVSCEWNPGNLDPAPEWKHVRLTVSHVQATGTGSPLFSVSYWDDVAPRRMTVSGRAVVRALAKAYPHG